MADGLIVKNQDLVGIIDRMNRFIVEWNKSSNADSSTVDAFTQTRAASYLDAIDRYHSWVVAQPQLDIQETSSKTYPLEPLPEIVNVENESLNDMIRFLVTVRDELINSQSARESCGVLPDDSSRLTSGIAKIRAFLVDYVSPTVPLDLPKSSPREQRTGPGKTGI